MNPEIIDKLICEWSIIENHAFKESELNSLVDLITMFVNSRRDEKLDIAVEALELISKYDPNQYDDKTCAGFMLLNYNYSKKSLIQIRGEK